MWGRGELRECAGSLPSDRAMWAGRADVGVGLAVRAHAMGVVVAEEGGRSDGQGPHASESGRANGWLG
jgi:hypothetical protein